MPEWLQATFATPANLSLADVARHELAALVLGCAVAGVYRLTQDRSNGQTTGLTATLVLLSVLIAMVTMVIGNDIARAFSLVGALSIVRFRTVVEDTRDTAFVIFAVAVGMAAGAGLVTVALIGLPVAAVAAFLFRPRPSPAPPVDQTAPEHLLTIRVGAGHDAQALLREVFAKHLEHQRLTSLTTSRQGAAVDLTYEVRLRRDDAAVALVTEINALPGVQSVELHAASSKR